MAKDVAKELSNCKTEFENDEGSMLFFNAVKKTFDSYPKNTDKVQIAVKVAVINQLYKTNILATFKITNHIQALGDKLDELLLAGDSDAVFKIEQGHRIRNKKYKKEYDFYSFSTKYCHFSNPSKYPIYDQFVSKALLKLRKKGLVEFENADSLYDTAELKRVMDDVLVKFHFADYQEADRALWVYGKKLAKEW